MRSPDADTKVFEHHQLISKAPRRIQNGNFSSLVSSTGASVISSFFQLFAAALSHFSGGSPNQIAVDVIPAIFGQCYIRIMLF